MESNRSVARVIVIGAGFGGLAVARGLCGAGCQVLVIDRSNHHLFQPLLYQVAMAGLSATEIARPIRAMLRRQRNARVLMEEVVGVDRARRVVRTKQSEHPYDYLVVAAGATHAYLGHPQWELHAPGLKSLGQAMEIRRRVLMAFEQAEGEAKEEVRRALMTFVVVGGGPTGVELSGAIGEMSRFTLARDFRTLDPTHARIVLVEAGPRILPTFDAGLATKASGALRRLGVDVRTGRAVTKIDSESVSVEGEVIACRTVLWAAGVAASPLGRRLSTDCDRAGRVRVTARLRLSDDPRVFVIGDAAAAPAAGGGTLPGVGGVAIQQGRYVATAIASALRGSTPPGDFRYLDRGQMATVGRRCAIAQLGRVKLAGRLAWYAWLFVHLMLLSGFHNRVFVLLEWVYGYLRFSRGARLILPQDWRQSVDLGGLQTAPAPPVVASAVSSSPPPARGAPVTRAEAVVERGAPESPGAPVGGTDRATVSRT